MPPRTSPSALRLAIVVVVAVTAFLTGSFAAGRVAPRPVVVSACLMADGAITQVTTTTTQPDCPPGAIPVRWQQLGPLGSPGPPAHGGAPAPAVPAGDPVFGCSAKAVTCVM